MSRKPQPPPHSSRSTPWEWNTGWLWVGLALICLTVYGPALNGGFLWDDNGHVTRLDLQSVGGLYRIWFEVGATQQYYPILHSAFWIEHLLWGDSTLGYHLINVLLHATTATQFAVLLRRLQVPGAALAALLFALHPVCVESVAWISEQKNTLCAVFYLSAALAWLRYDTDRRPRNYAWASVLFLLALLTKTVTATLPAALLVVAWWQRGRLDWRRDVVPLLPWFVLGAAGGLFTAHFERTLIGASGAAFDLGGIERLLLAGRVFWFYLGSLAWPVNLTFMYPRWTVDASLPLQWLPLLASLALLVGLVWWSRRSRGPLAAGLLFAGTLFPVLGFFNVYPFLFSYVADHFQYLASLAIFALAAAGLGHASNLLPCTFRFAVPAILLAVLGVLTWRQSQMYRNEFTLYETTLARNPASWMARNNLAMALANAGQVEAAIPHLEAALKLRPNYPQALSNLGDDLTRLGRAREALPYLERALALQPQFFQAQGNLANALVMENRVAEAIAHYERALALNPQSAMTEVKLGTALAALGRTEEAIPHFERALQLKPDFAEAEERLAIALMLTDRFPAAVPHFEKAIALDPQSPERRSTYGRALVQAHRYPEAIVQYEAAVRLDPDNAETQMILARGLRQAGRLQEAGEHYQRAITLKPELAGAR